MNLRIIGGFLKGRPLKSPTGPLARPTMSLVRKAVFDICQSQIEEACFLDLFACSGAMGIEAISRGAKQSTFIEKDRKTAHLLSENLKDLKVEGQGQVLCGDVFMQIGRLASVFDIVYIDPPYPLVEREDRPIATLLQLLDESRLLAGGAMVFLEERAPGLFSAHSLQFEHLIHKSTRRFGASVLHQLIYRKELKKI